MNWRYLISDKRIKRRWAAGRFVKGFLTKSFERKNEFHEAYLKRGGTELKWNLSGMHAIYEVTYEKGWGSFFRQLPIQKVGRNVREFQEIESRLMVWWPEGVFKSHEWFWNHQNVLNQSVAYQPHLYLSRPHMYL